MKTLNVVKVRRNQIAEKWGTHPWSLPAGELFIRCNSKAEINWDIAPVYTWQEIQAEQKKRPVHFLVPKETFELP